MKRHSAHHISADEQWLLKRKPPLNLSINIFQPNNEIEKIRTRCGLYRRRAFPDALRRKSLDRIYVNNRKKRDYGKNRSYSPKTFHPPKNPDPQNAQKRLRGIEILEIARGHNG